MKKLLLGLWPLYGAALGGAGAALFVSASRFLPVPVAALAVVVFWASVSQTLREDLRIGAPRGPLLPWRILPRALLAAVWIAAFVHEGTSRAGVLRMTATAIAAHSISRAGTVAMVYVSRPAARGLELCARLSFGPTAFAAVIGFLAALVLGVGRGAVLILGAYLILRAARGWFYRQHSGIDGDDVAHARMLVECFVLLVSVSIGVSGL